MRKPPDLIFKEGTLAIEVAAALEYMKFTHAYEAAVELMRADPALMDKMLARLPLREINKLISGFKFTR